MAMAVVDTGYDLLEELAAILLLKLAMVDDVVKELTARDVPGGLSMTSGGQARRANKSERKGRGDDTREHRGGQWERASAVLLTHQRK